MGEGAREGLIDNSHFGRSRRVALVEITAGQKGSFQSLEITGAHPTLIHRFLLPGVLAIHPNIVVGHVAAQRNKFRLGSGVHARNRAHLCEQFALKRLTALGGELS